MKIKIVNMGELRCTTKPKTLLLTQGVTTCIAFAMSGHFYDEEDNLKEFSALFHWQGFNINELDPIGHVETVFEGFLNSTRKNLPLEGDETINIKKLMFIGGEQKQCDEQGQTLVSGTEAEVNALITMVQAFDFAEYNYRLEEKAIEHYHFLTTGTSAIEVKIQRGKCNFTIEDQEALELESADPVIRI
jgi:hypothetical protein